MRKMVVGLILVASAFISVASTTTVPPGTTSYQEDYQNFVQQNPAAEQKRMMKEQEKRNMKFQICIEKCKAESEQCYQMGVVLPLGRYGCENKHKRCVDGCA